MLQPHRAHRPRESAGAQAALGLCWHPSPAVRAGPQGQGPLSCPRAQAPAALSRHGQGHITPHGVLPTPKGLARLLLRPPVLPEVLSPLSTLCCCLGHRPWQKRVVRAGLWPLGARDTKTRLAMGPPEPSIFAMLQAAFLGPGGDSQDLGRDQASVCLHVL